MSTPMLLSLQPPDSEGFVTLSATSSDDAEAIDWQGLLKSYHLKQTYLEWTPTASTAAPSTPTRSRYPMDMTAYELDMSAFKEYMVVTKALGSTQVCVGCRPCCLSCTEPRCLLSAFVAP